jgi:uncharacterized membrane protein YjfL (UPF0719 family)
MTPGIIDQLAAFGHAALLALEVLLLTYAAKKVDDWRTSQFDDDALIVEKGNVALALRRAGLYLGGMLGMAGVLASPSQGLPRDLLGVLIFGAAAYAALFAARALCRLILLRGLADDDACMKGNTAVGLAEGGLFLATGLVLQGSLTGGGGDLLHGLLSFLIFFALGQLALLAAALIFEALGLAGTRAEIASGNTAVAAEMAGVLVATALVLRSSVEGPSDGLGGDIGAFLTSAVSGIALLCIFQVVLRWLFLRKANLREALHGGNLAVALVLQALTVAFAGVVAGLLA